MNNDARILDLKGYGCASFPG